MSENKKWEFVDQTIEGHLLVRTDRLIVPGAIYIKQLVF
jgi:hypothetical protein